MEEIGLCQPESLEISHFLEKIQGSTGIFIILDLSIYFCR